MGSDRPKVVVTEWQSWACCLGFLAPATQQVPQCPALPCPCDLPGNRSDLGHCVIFPSAGVSQGLGAWNTQGHVESFHWPSRRPNERTVSLWESGERGQGLWNPQGQPSSCCLGTNRSQDER